MTRTQRARGLRRWRVVWCIVPIAAIFMFGVSAAGMEKWFALNIWVSFGIFFVAVACAIAISVVMLVKVSRELGEFKCPRCGGYFFREVEAGDGALSRALFYRGCCASCGVRHPFW